MFQKMTSLEANDLILKHKDNTEFVIIDFRTSEEFATGHLENAINFDYYSKDLKDHLSKLDKNRIYLIYCRSGYRSGFVFEIMKKMEFQQVYEFGGILDWLNSGFFVIR